MRRRSRDIFKTIDAAGTGCRRCRLHWVPHGRIVRQDNRFSYGEVRYELIGRIEGRLFVLIYTPRHDGIRIISARKANSREVKRYENCSHSD